MKKQEPPSIVTAVAVSLDALHPAPWNPRTIKDERFQNLCRSIEADPALLWRWPVLAMADGTIYAGNMRYRAAQHLKFSAIPAVIEDLPERLAKERALRDNSQWGEWLDDDLAALLGELAANESDLALLGLDDQQLAKLLGMEGSPPANQSTFAYEEKFAVTVMCADATDQERIYNELKERGYECRVVVV